MDSSKVSKQAIEKAITSLLKWDSSKSQFQKPQLLPSDEFLYLVLTLHKIPSTSRTNPFKISLPNPLFISETVESCLILDDRHVSSKSAKQKVIDEQIPVSKVVKFTKLKTDYKPYESKRKLCDSYELFFADKRVIPLLPRAIGKHFYKKKKIPIPIELGRKNWKEQILRCYSSALLFMNTGTCCVVKVARASMGRDEIVENVVAAVNGVVEFVPKKWGNVRSLHLKFSSSVALPVYQAMPELKMKIGGVVVRDENVELLESDKDGEIEKKSESKKVVRKKGRIHEVRYMDNVGFREMVGRDESGSDDDDGGMVDVEEIEDGELGNAGKKRKKGDGVKKVVKVKKGEKSSKQKKVKVSGKLVTKKKSKNSKALL